MSIRVGIIMGSDSDLPVMRAAQDVLNELAVECEMQIVSAHRTPDRLYEYATSAESRGLRVIIAGAGGAAHLPGMAAAISVLPVIGVPVSATRIIPGVRGAAHITGINTIFVDSDDPFPEGFVL